MTGRDIAPMAFDLQKPPRVPVTQIGGGAWAVQSEPSCPERPSRSGPKVRPAWMPGEMGRYILTVGCDFTKNVPLGTMKALMSFRKQV